MMKPTPARLEVLERNQSELTKRLDALLMILEKQSEQLNVLVNERPQDGYKPIFDRWPGQAR